MQKLTQQDTARSYDAIADHWNGDRFNRENGIDQHSRAIRFASETGSALDVGCGSSGRIIDLLQSSGFEAEGLDISESMLELAQARHPEVTFHLADIVTWTFPKKYDFISAWDSVWHVPLEHQEDVLNKLCSGLAHSGVLIYTTGGIDSSEEGSNPFMGQPLYHAALGIPKILEVILQAECICRHLEYDQTHGDDPGKHLYLIIQKA